MAKTKGKIDKKVVKAGRLIRVENTNIPKLSNAAKEYFSVWVEDADGSNERCWFLTGKDVEKLEHRSQKNKEDWTKKGILIDIID
jgi:hypothetical protein